MPRPSRSTESLRDSQRHASDTPTSTEINHRMDGSDHPTATKIAKTAAHIIHGHIPDMNADENPIASPITSDAATDTAIIPA